MIKGKYLLGIAVFAVVLLWSAVYGGSALAEISLGGKVETHFLTQFSSGGEAGYNWIQHLHLELLLPAAGNLTGRAEFDLYSQSNPQFGLSPFTFQLSKLYLKQRFEHLHLTVGRQPISWSFGSLVNPADYSVAGLSGSSADLARAVQSYDGVVGYIPLGQASDLSVAATFPVRSKHPKLAARVRTQAGPFEVGMNCIRDVFVVQQFDGGGQPVGQSDDLKIRIAATAKGDLGVLGVYGAAGTVMDQGSLDGAWLGMAGLDTSIPVTDEAKLVAQLEYIYDRTNLLQRADYGPHLLVGSLNYELDEFAGVGIAGLVNPTDRSYILAPVYQNQIGDGLELTVTGAYFGGDPGTQFGPALWPLDGSILTPRMMMQVGLGYSF